MQFLAGEDHRARGRANARHRLLDGDGERLRVACLGWRRGAPVRLDVGKRHVARQLDVDRPAVPPAERQHAVDLGGGGVGIVEDGAAHSDLGEDARLGVEVADLVVEEAG